MRLNGIIMKKLCKWISDYMGALVLVLSLVALVAPDVFGAFKPTIINPVLGIIMFGMGMALKIDDFKIVFSRPKDVIIGCLAQFTVMPLLVWLLAGQSVHVDVAGMLLSILWVVILPIVAGLVVKWFWPRFTERTTDYLPAVSSLAIAFIVSVIISANAQKLLMGGFVIILVVVLHNLCGLCLGWLVGRVLHLSDAKRRAISIEVGMQNSGLASSLATLHFAAYPMATIPGAVFSVWHNISGAIVARLHAKSGIKS